MARHAASAAETVTAEDLAPVLDGHRGEQALRAAVEAAAAPAAPRAALLSLLARFIQFNRPSARDWPTWRARSRPARSSSATPTEPVHILADRASEVAADFFYAAVDEFDDRLTPWRDTHRTLAQATLKGLGAHFGYTPAQLNDVIRINAATEDRARRGMGGLRRRRAPRGEAALLRDGVPRRQRGAGRPRVHGDRPLPARASGPSWWPRSRGWRSRCSARSTTPTTGSASTPAWRPSTSRPR